MRSRIPSTIFTLNVDSAGTNPSRWMQLLYYFDWFVSHMSQDPLVRPRFWNMSHVTMTLDAWKIRFKKFSRPFHGQFLKFYQIVGCKFSLSQVTPQMVWCQNASAVSQVTPSDESIEIVQYVFVNRIATLSAGCRMPRRREWRCSPNLTSSANLNASIILK